MIESGPHICRLFDLPANFDALADDVARGLLSVYGEEGASLYRQHARQIFSAYLHSPNMRFWAVMEGDSCSVVALTNLNAGRGEVSLVHALRGSLDGSAEERLLRAALDDLAERGAGHMLSEFLPTSSLDCRPFFESAGFARVPRMVLSKALSDEPTTRTWSSGLQELGTDDVTAAADCLVRAYAEDPGRALHREIQTVQQSETFVNQVLTGKFGATGPGMNLCLWRASECVGVILGCLLAPSVGFTMQVAVIPEERGAGSGKELLEAQLHAFAMAGCDTACLAVTRSNTVARGMYESQGYLFQRDFDAYFWYQDSVVD